MSPDFKKAPQSEARFCACTCITAVVAPGAGTSLRPKVLP